MSPLPVVPGVEGFRQGDSLLITTDDWFYTPDGQSYKAAWGPVEIHPALDVLGFKPTNSENWLAKVGSGDGAVLIFGCRIHYIVRCQARPLGSAVYCTPAEGARP